MSQRLPDYEALRASQARSQQADRIGPNRCLAVVLDNDRITTWCARDSGHAGPHLDIPEHVREVIAVYEGYGAEAWCPNCRVHWPCKFAK